MSNSFIIGTTTLALRYDNLKRQNLTQLNSDHDYRLIEIFSVYTRSTFHSNCLHWIPFLLELIDIKARDFR